MNTLIVSHHSLDYDGRLNELIKVADSLGEVYLFSLDSKRKVKNGQTFSENNYSDFLLGTIRAAKSLPHIDLVLVDGRKAIIPARIVKHMLHECKMALDCREMDFPEYTSHSSGKIGCYIEKPCIKSADIVIAANLERAGIMQDRYKLKRRPLVFENIRALAFDDSFDEERAKEKFTSLLQSKGISVISSAGCFADRLTSTLVENFDKITTKADLYLVGSSSTEEEELIRDIITRNNLVNVHIMGRVTQGELKYLIRNCHIGIVGYHQRTPNYKYCASGKIYEYIFEGIPVVTTTNPPLLNMCNNYGIGVPDDEFYNGINKVIENYSFYTDNVRKLLDKDLVAENVNKVVDDIRKMIQ